MPPSPPYSCWLGWDPGDMPAFVVAERSLQSTSTHTVQIQRVALSWLQQRGLYVRLHAEHDGQLWDVISAAPMSTQHAIARFFVPLLMAYQGWALFTDGDVLFRDDITALFDLADERYAVQVVQHPPLESTGTKKAGHIQQPYLRKNWSSVMLFNCAHPAHRTLTLGVLNGLPGRDLHRFCWLTDEEIGALPPRWNWLVGLSAPEPDPAIVHYTLGSPSLPDHAHDPYADEWHAVAQAAGYHWDRPPVAGP